jgi:NADH-quinone oxidoreductase subunit L
VRPFVWFARKNERDGIDLAILTIPSALGRLNRGLVRTQTGQIRWYAASMALGAVVLIAAVILS